MNFVDLIFALIIVLAMARGWSRGLLATVATYAAPVLGFMIAADASDPVRDWLATAIEAPDIALDLLAPLVVFIVVVSIVRLIAALLARLLGVGRSLPGRVLGAAVSGGVLALLLGAGVMMVDEVSPAGRHATAPVPGPTPGPAPGTGGTAPAPQKGNDPLVDLVMDIDRQLDESLLAPKLASLASDAWARISGKHPDTAAEAISKEIEDAKDKAADAVERGAADAMQRSAADALQRRAVEPVAPTPAPATPPNAADASRPPAASAPAASTRPRDGDPKR